jgi:hypothetical protein
MLIVAIATAAGCASGPAQSVGDTVRVHGNATVRSVVYMAAAPDAATAEPSAAPGTANPGRNPLARAHRYTYTVELDSGQFRTFGFAEDQQFRVGDRVVVTESGVAVTAR